VDAIQLKLSEHTRKSSNQ